MTRRMFFDTDCISAFLWVKNENILTKLYPGLIVIPEPVYAELSHPAISHLKDRVDKIVETGDAEIIDIQFGSREWDTFILLIGPDNPAGMIIGKGEAAAIALAKENNGVLASNNLKDISFYVGKFKLEHVTTADIMLQAYEKGFVTEGEAETIWHEMLKKRRKLGYGSFSEMMKDKKGGK